MAEDMEMFLEQVIKKTNPEEYIKILEQDREDFAEEINRLNNIIDEFEKWLEEQKYRNSEWDNFVSDGVRIGIPRQYIIDKLNKLKGDNK